MLVYVLVEDNIFMKDEKEKEKIEEKTSEQAKQTTKCMYCPYCMNQICPMF